MNARYYVPYINRFASADTIVPDPMNPQTFNRYSYVLNNPVNFVDPSGHIACKDIQSECQVVDEEGIADWSVGEDSGYDQVALVAQLAYLQMYDMYIRYWASDTMWEALPGLSHEETLATFAYEYASGLADEFGSQNVYNVYSNTGLVGESIALLMGASGERMFSASVQAILNPCHSFSADTVVLTDEGLVPIVDLEVGDWVYGYDEVTEDMAYYPVTATWAHIDTVIVYLTIDSEVIETTPSHLFYTEIGWIEAGDLWLDAMVRTANENYGRVQNIAIVEQSQWMYDVTVGVAHTFFVGDRGWLVHNSDCPLFDRSGIRTTDHFADRLDDWGISERDALNIYNNGQKWTNEYGEFIAWDPKKKIAIRVDNLDYGAISIWEQPARPRVWIRGWVDPSD